MLDALLGAVLRGAAVGAGFGFVAQQMAPIVSQLVASQTVGQVTVSMMQQSKAGRRVSENRRRYPPNWRQISDRIRFDRAQDAANAKANAALATAATAATPSTAPRIRSPAASWC